MYVSLKANAFLIITSYLGNFKYHSLTCMNWHYLLSCTLSIYIIYNPPTLLTYKLYYLYKVYTEMPSLLYSVFNNVTTYMYDTTNIQFNGYATLLLSLLSSILWLNLLTEKQVPATKYAQFVKRQSALI